MIISKSVVVKNSKHYKELGYISDLRYIEINISDLPIGSHFKIVAKCDYCNNEKEVVYRDYNKSISINGKYSCSIKCGNLKSKETNLEKYGVDHISQVESFKDKSKKTIREKYGVDHISQIDSVRSIKSNKMIKKGSEISERIKEYWSSITDLEMETINDKRSATNLEKYGVKHVSQVEEFKSKIKSTNLEKWGGYTYQSDVLMDKVISTNLERYGVTNSSSSEIIRNRVKETNLEIYGFEYASQSPIVKLKAIKTNLEKYGVENVMFLPSVVTYLRNKFYDKYGVDSYFKTDEFKKSLKYNPISNEIFRSNLIISNHRNYIRYIDNEESEFSCDCGESHLFTISSVDFHNRNRINKSICTTCYPIGDQKSISEKELFSFVNRIYNKEVISGYRDELEIDVYLPDLKIGFEFNGLYYHSDKFKEKNYHLDKTNFFKNKGIRIVHIWEDDWAFKRNIIESQIKNWIELPTNRIYARKCSIRNVDQLEYKNFLNNNHIQGFIRSKIRIGLFHNNELISLMTFDNLEGRKSMEEGGWNLSRFCSTINTNVIGGSSKLLKYFINEYKPKRIISFADLDWSTGDLYYKLGFNISNILKPDYKYVNGDNRLNKQKFTKKKLKNMGYDISKTESQITKEIGLSKIYNCGQLKFEIII